MSKFTEFIEKEPETVKEIEKMPFSAMETKKTKGQKFGNPKLIKCGKEFDVREWINSGREDTEIYPTLEKYGCIDRMKLDVEGVFGDFTEMKDMRSLIEQAQKADEMWHNLPMEVREHFQNNKQLFVEGGEKYLKDIIESNKKQETVQGAENQQEVNDAQ